MKRWSLNRAGMTNHVGDCYLHSSNELDPNTMYDEYNFQPAKAKAWMPYPQLRYTNGVAIQFESGVMDGEAFPSDFYGCPYPPVPSGVCTQPAGWGMDGANQVIFPTTS